jgi:chemotaxis protein CheD
MTRTVSSGTGRKQVIVGMADMKATNETCGVLSTYVLGSCLAVSVFDPLAGVAGMLHFLLPDSAINIQRALQNPYLFADTGIPLLFRSAYKLGAEKERIVCRVAGGSHFLDPENMFDVGEQNYQVAVRILGKNNVKIDKEYVGGLAGIMLNLHLGTGRTTVSLPGGEEIEL